MKNKRRRKKLASDDPVFVMADFATESPRGTVEPRPGARGNVTGLLPTQLLHVGDQRGIVLLGDHAVPRRHLRARLERRRVPDPRDELRVGRIVNGGLAQVSDAHAVVAVAGGAPVTVVELLAL